MSGNPTTSASGAATATHPPTPPPPPSSAEEAVEAASCGGGGGTTGGGGCSSYPVRKRRKTCCGGGGGREEADGTTAMDDGRGKIDEGEEGMEVEGTAQLSPWEDLPSGMMLRILEALHCQDNGEAWVRTSGCVCRVWKSVSEELLMRDTAASRPPRRPVSQTSGKEDGPATSVAIVKDDESMSKSVSGGGSEHQSPALPVRSAQRHEPGFRVRRLTHVSRVGVWRRRRPPEPPSVGAHRFSSADPPRRGAWEPQSSGRCLHLLSVQFKGSEATSPSPQKAVVEDMNLLSGSDAEGGAEPSSHKTGDKSESSAPSRPVPQPTC